MRIIIKSLVVLSVLIFLSSVLVGCKKEVFVDVIKRDTVTIVKRDTFFPLNTVTYKRSFDSITATVPSATKIVRIDGFEATNDDSFSDCSTFKYAGYFRVNSKFGNRLTVNFSTKDSIVTMKCSDPSILIDSFFTKDKYSVSFIIKAKHDTIEDPSVKFFFQTADKKLITTNLVDIVGEIATKCYGTAFWATRRFRISEGTYNRAVSKAIPIDSNYVPLRGDIIYWDGPHYGTVFTTPIVSNLVKFGKPYKEYYYEILEMNAKCTGAKSTKVNRTLSNDVLNTILSYDVDRGAPEYYYRNL
jgi:hypothetical protein